MPSESIYKRLCISGQISGAELRLPAAHLTFKLLHYTRFKSHIACCISSYKFPASEKVFCASFPAEQRAFLISCHASPVPVVAVHVKYGQSF